MSTFVMVLRQSVVFRPEWVERLARQAKTHLKPDRVVCFSDVDVPCERIPLITTWQGWFSKVEMFRPGLLSGPCLYADLDTLILRPIPDLWETIQRESKLLLLSDLGAPHRPQSGVVGWVPCHQTARIFVDFAHNPARGLQTRHGDGGWMGRYPHARLQTFWPDVFRSFKYQNLDAGPRDTVVCCFHGRPKFNNLHANHWAVKYWLGKTG